MPSGSGWRGHCSKKGYELCARGAQQQRQQGAGPQKQAKRGVEALVHVDQYSGHLLQCASASLVQWGMSLKGERDSNGV